MDLFLSDAQNEFRSRTPSSLRFDLPSNRVRWQKSDDVTSRKGTVYNIRIYFLRQVPTMDCQKDYQRKRYERDVVKFLLVVVSLERDEAFSDLLDLCCVSFVDLLEPRRPLTTRTSCPSSFLHFNHWVILNCKIGHRKSMKNDKRFCELTRSSFPWMMYDITYWQS